LVFCAWLRGVAKKAAIKKLSASAAINSAGAKDCLLVNFIHQLLMPPAWYFRHQLFDARDGMIVGIVAQSSAILDCDVKTTCLRY
jgi:hypothetical protein